MFILEEKEQWTRLDDPKEVNPGPVEWNFKQKTLIWGMFGPVTKQYRNKGPVPEHDNSKM